MAFGDFRHANDLSTSQYSNYQFTTTPENFISAITESGDASTAYPNPTTQTASFNISIKLPIFRVRH